MKKKSVELLGIAYDLLETNDEDARARMDYPENVSWSYFREMPEAEVFERMSGSAMTDDPPAGWNKKRQAAFLRGYLYAEWKRAKAAHHSYVRPMRFIKEVLESEEVTP